MKFNKIYCLTFLLLVSLYFRAQQKGIIEIKQESSLKNYKKVINDAIKFYNDSSKKAFRHEYFFIILKINKIDTALNELDFIIDNSIYTPFYSFNPTHFVLSKSKKVLLKYSNNIDKTIIKQLAYYPINGKDIEFVKKQGKIYADKNGMPTGSPMPVFIFKLKDDTISYKWIIHGQPIDIEENIRDFEYINSKEKYEDYLKKKLKEYGY